MLIEKAVFEMAPNCFVK